MKKIILITILNFIAFSCNQVTNKSKNENIRRKESINKIRNNYQIKLIGEKNKTLEECEKEFACKFSFEIVDSISNVNKYITSIVLEKISNWNDPGDFHKISIVYNSKKYTFFNISGWVKVSEVEEQYFNKNSLINSKYCRIWNIKENVIGVFLFGYIYASIPGLLSIIVCEDKPNLIFNDNYNLFFVDDKISQISVTRDDKDINENNINIVKYLYKDYNLTFISNK